MTDDLVVIGASYAGENRDGAAYLFSLDGTEVSKLEPDDYGEQNDQYGLMVSMDEKIVIVTKDYTKLFIFTTDGDLLKEFDEEESDIENVSITVEYIVYITDSKTVVYSNSEPDFPLVREIEQGGDRVATAGDKLVIGDTYYDSAWLYNIDGTLVKELEHDTPENSFFGISVAIANDKILVGASYDDVGGDNTGSVFFYSAIDGAFQEKVLAPDAQEDDRFGSSICSNGSYYTVGTHGNDEIGSAYLFNLPS